MDLISLSLTLRPLRLSETPIPVWWGRAAHALLLHAIEQVDPALSASLHGETLSEEGTVSDPPAPKSGLRPVTASNLVGRFQHGELDLNGVYTLRFTAFEPAAAAALHHSAQAGVLAPGQAIELDYLPFQIESAHTGTATYHELAASRLVPGEQPPPRRIALKFASPTTFKSGGKHVPVPLPDLVFGSLLERWNAFAPIAFPAEVRRYAAECLAISRYALSTRAIPLKGFALRVGAVGEATYTSLNYDRYWMSVLSALAAFAAYAGVGAGTAMGLGQVKEIEIREPRMENSE